MSSPVVVVDLLAALFFLDPQLAAYAAFVLWLLWSGAIFLAARRLGEKQPGWAFAPLGDLIILWRSAGFRGWRPVAEPILTGVVLPSLEVAFIIVIGPASATTLGALLLAVEVASALWRGSRFARSAVRLGSPRWAGWLAGFPVLGLPFAWVVAISGRPSSRAQAPANRLNRRKGEEVETFSSPPTTRTGNPTSRSMDAPETVRRSVEGTAADQGTDQPPPQAPPSWTQRPDGVWVWWDSGQHTWVPVAGSHKPGRTQGQSRGLRRVTLLGAMILTAVVSVGSTLALVRLDSESTEFLSKSDGADATVSRLDGFSLDVSRIDGRISSDDRVRSSQIQRLSQIAAASWVFHLLTNGQINQASTSSKLDVCTNWLMSGTGVSCYP